MKKYLVVVQGKHTKGETYYLNTLNYQEKIQINFFKLLKKTTGENKNKITLELLYVIKNMNLKTIT